MAGAGIDGASDIAKAQRQHSVRQFARGFGFICCRIFSPANEIERQIFADVREIAVGCAVLHHAEDVNPKCHTCIKTTERIVHISFYFCRITRQPVKSSAMTRNGIAPCPECKLWQQRAWHVRAFEHALGIKQCHRSTVLDTTIEIGVPYSGRIHRIRMRKGVVQRDKPAH